MITRSNTLQDAIGTSEARLHPAGLGTRIQSARRERIAAFKPARSEFRRRTKALGVLDLAGDFFAAATSVLLAYYVYRGLHIGNLAIYRFSDIAAVACLVGICFITILKSYGGYTQAMSLLRVRETERVIAAFFQLCLFAFAASFWARFPVPRFVVLFSAIVLPLLVLAEKHFICEFTRSLYTRGFAPRRTVIYGAGLGGNHALSVLARSPRLGFDPVAVVDDDISQIGNEIRESAYTKSRSLYVVSGPITAEMLRNLSAEVVIISSPSISAEKFEQISLEAALAGASLSFVPHDAVTSSGSLSYWDADGMIFASANEQETDSVYRFVKRAFDLAVALFLLLLLLPFLIAIGIAIRVTSRGPALFVQNRVGKEGRIFKMYKFRTMTVNAPQYGYSPRSSDDPRITRIGAFLRRISLDEFPQLLNVLIGDMSLVGPRPEMPFIVEQYNEIHRQRLRVMPGITGMWQISADRAHLIHHNIQYDLYYIRHRNFFMDIAILLHTFAFAMRGI